MKISNRFKIIIKNLIRHYLRRATQKVLDNASSSPRKATLPYRIRARWAHSLGSPFPQGIIRQESWRLELFVLPSVKQFKKDFKNFQYLN